MENILPEKTNEQIGIQLGSLEATVVVEEYVNLSCPYCKKWFEDSKDTYKELIENGTVRRVLKPFNKEKFGLHYANVMHDYLPKNGNYDETVAVMEKIYATQNQWGPRDHEASLESVTAFAEETLGLTKAEDEAMTEAILKETTEAGIRFIPTMIIGDHVFDQKISQEEFRQLIEEAK